MKNRTVTEKKYRITENSEEYTPLSSFRFGERIRFVLETGEKEDVRSVVLRFHRDSDGEMLLFPMRISGDSVRAETFGAVVDSAVLCKDRNGGLLYYCYDVYFADRCITFGGEEPEYLLPCGEEKKRQLLVYRTDYRTPEWLQGGIIYHIFVDRFCRGAVTPLKPGAVLNPDWENGIPQFGAYPGADVDNNEFFGGDLYGIAQKLDYIASLGVTCLYLSPIFDATSNHKYDTGDYEHVDSMFGGDEALDALIRKAEEKGIHIILDGVFNHTGADSRYFNRKGSYPALGAWQSKESPYYSWYSFQEYPEKYDCWWGVKILPKVRCDEPTYRQYILGENGIIQKWMSRGIRGWRLDVADELSDGFLDALRERVRCCDPEAVIYGEVWENASNKIAYGKRRRYLQGGQLDSVMNYPLKNAVIAYIRDGDDSSLRECVQTIYRQYPRESANVLMNFLGTHDTARILTELGGEPAGERSNAELSVARMTETQREKAIARLKIAYRLISVMPGLPCIFYGDEAGMEGYGDPFCRRPFPWGREEQELTDSYRQTGWLHRSTPVFRNGEVRLLSLSENAAAVLRYNGTDPSVLLLLNRSEVPVSFRLSKEVQGVPSGEKTIEPVILPVSAQFFMLDGSDVVAEEHR